MSDSDHLPQDPAPGWSAPGSAPDPSPAPVPPVAPAPPPGWGPGWGAPAAAPGYGGAAPVPPAPLALHKPGAIPFRPLRLGEIYDGAFRTIRANPRATVGAAVLMSVLAMALPLLLTTIVTFTIDVPLNADLEPEAGSMSTSEAIAVLLSFGSLVLGSFALYVGSVLVGAMVSQVTLAAAVGTRMSLDQAWRSTRGVRWRLIGLMATILLGLVVLVGVWGLVLLLLGLGGAGDGVLIAWGLFSGAFLVVPAMVVLWVRVTYLAVPALMLERRGVFGSFAVARRLTRGAFWRTFGIALLTVGLTTIASNLLATPVSVIGQLVIVAAPDYALLTLTVMTALASVVGTAFVAPFTGAVCTLQYLDQRIRREGFEVELMRRAGLLG